MDEQPAATATKPNIDNDPTSTLRTGFRQLALYNSRPFIAVILFSFACFLLLLFAIGIVALGLLALVLASGQPEMAQAVYAQLPQETAEVAATMSMSGIVACLLIGTVIALFCVALAKVMQLTVAAASVENQRLGMGELFAKGFGRLLPLFTLLALAWLVATLSFIGITIVLQAWPILGLLLVLGFLAALIYLSLRLSLAPIILVAEKRGPIAALRRSWHLTNGHVTEVLGLIATIAVCILVPLGSMSIFVQVAPELSFLRPIILGVLLTFLAAAMTSVAQRYRQLRQIAEGTANASYVHSANYWAIIMLIVTCMLLAMFSPRLPGTTVPELRSPAEDAPFQEELLPGEGEPEGPQFQVN